MKAINKRHAAITLLAIAMVTAAGAANAQLIGGGGGGYGQQIIQWVVTNIVQALIEGAIIFAGVLLLFGRHQLAGIAVLVVGAIVITHYQEIAGLFPVG